MVTEAVSSPGWCLLVTVGVHVGIISSSCVVSCACNAAFSLAVTVVVTACAAVLISAFVTEGYFRSFAPPRKAVIFTALTAVRQHEVLMLYAGIFPCEPVCTV